MNQIPSVTAMRLDLTPTLDHPCWNTVPTHEFGLLREAVSGSPQEPGKIRFAHDGDRLFAHFELKDTDIVQESQADQCHHYLTGDVVELFLKPKGETWYWEYYVTPNACKTAFFYPGRGRKGLPGCLDYRSGMEVAARIDGTLNDWRDRDICWTAMISVPLVELSIASVSPNAPGDWRVLVGRYNYGRYLPEPELSMFPRLGKLDFHRYEEWAKLKLGE